MESRDSGIHIALVAHTRKSQRDTDSQDRMDIRGAGEISDLADAVGILNRNREQERKIEVSFEKDYKPTEPHAFLRIAKQRHGSGWEGNIGLYFDQATQTFLDTEGQCPVSHLLCGETRPSESKERTPRGIPWPEWFRQKFGRDLFEYVRDARAVDLRSQFVTHPTQPKKTTR